MAYTDSDIGAKFSFFDERFTERENKISMIMKVVQDWLIQIIDDCIPIIWYNSNAESGPRALENRSILADSRTLESKKILNQLK